MKFIKTATTFAVFTAVALLSGCGSLDLKKEGEVSFVNGPTVSTQERERDNGSKFCEVLVGGKLKGAVEGECGPTLAMYDALHRQPTAVARPQVASTAVRYMDNVVRPTAKTLHGYEPGTKADGTKFCRLYFTDNSTLEIPIQGNTCAELSDVINTLQFSGAQQRVTYVDQPEERVVRTAAQQVVYQQSAQAAVVTTAVASPSVDPAIRAGLITGGGALLGAAIKGDRKGAVAGGVLGFLYALFSTPSSATQTVVAPNYGGDSYLLRSPWGRYTSPERAYLDYKAEEASLAVQRHNARNDACGFIRGDRFHPDCQR